MTDPASKYDWRGFKNILVVANYYLDRRENEDKGISPDERTNGQTDTERTDGRTPCRSPHNENYRHRQLGGICGPNHMHPNQMHLTQDIKIPASDRIKLSLLRSRDVAEFTQTAYPVDSHSDSPMIS